mgnify:CR=1 FL=1
MITLGTIGRAIAKFRTSKGMSQEDLAAEANVNRGYISRIENGRVAFSVTVLLKICKALEIDPGHIFRL